MRKIPDFLQLFLHFNLALFRFIQVLESSHELAKVFVPVFSNFVAQSAKTLLFAEDLVSFGNNKIAVLDRLGSLLATV